jgi:ATP-dependent DNA ligase
VRARPRLSGFIEPCLPSAAAGDGWVHEIKLDGFRMQRDVMALACSF